MLVVRNCVINNVHFWIRSFCCQLLHLLQLSHFSIAEIVAGIAVIVTVIAAATAAFAAIIVFAATDFSLLMLPAQLSCGIAAIAAIVAIVAAATAALTSSSSFHSFHFWQKNILLSQSFCWQSDVLLKCQKREGLSSEFSFLSVLTLISHFREDKMTLIFGGLSKKETDALSSACCCNCHCHWHSCTVFVFPLPVTLPLVLFAANCCHHHYCHSFQCFSHSCLLLAAIAAIAMPCHALQLLHFPSLQLPCSDTVLAKCPILIRKWNMSHFLISSSHQNEKVFACKLVQLSPFATVSLCIAKHFT